MGVYADNPLGRIGYLQSAAFRSSRLVVDTGIHAKGWSREQAIQSMMEATGNDEARTVTEIERYCVIPGQACSYMVGKQAILRMRASAQQALGRSLRLKGLPRHAAHQRLHAADGHRELVQRLGGRRPERLKAPPSRSVFRRGWRFVATPLPSLFWLARLQATLVSEGEFHMHITRRALLGATAAGVVLACVRAPGSPADRELTHPRSRSSHDIPARVAGVRDLARRFGRASGRALHRSPERFFARRPQRALQIAQTGSTNCAR